jgi:hypothetical protein
MTLSVPLRIRQVASLGKMDGILCALGEARSGTNPGGTCQGREQEVESACSFPSQFGGGPGLVQLLWR